MKQHAHTDALAVFEQFSIRRVYDEVQERWYFSVIDIVAALTEQHDYQRAKTYWTTLKNRLKNEGSEVVTNCDRLKLQAQDGKMRATDVDNQKEDRSFLGCTTATRGTVSAAAREASRKT